ncbi:hypothetical protein PPGU19_102690 (plasmid) [Paraburkholderia sp. PGU19]|uniref:Uncharacterized protein n=1 Tax=Paraburkholderia terrae TaxID=311230 RepID=A0ABM7U1W5_9BURK|nr:MULTISPECIES: hypothetical protein [Paraburkholderia]BCG05701.1 hypothetical protein PPGU19_102690 [Paraburkholderia sp. PGU19]BCZ85125.1 hypothetical protein PTKU64_88000 [Paraburkholderia terrae]
MNRRDKHAKTSRAAPEIMPRPPALPEMSDEAAAQIQQLLCDWLLWFSAAYGEQIRRCNEPWAAPRREPPSPHRIDDPF